MIVSVNWLEFIIAEIEVQWLYIGSVKLPCTQGIYKWSNTIQYPSFISLVLTCVGPFKLKYEKSFFYEYRPCTFTIPVFYFSIYYLQIEHTYFYETEDKCIQWHLRPNFCKFRGIIKVQVAEGKRTCGRIKGILFKPLSSPSVTTVQKKSLKDELVSRLQVRGFSSATKWSFLYQLNFRLFRGHHQFGTLKDREKGPPGHPG